MVENLLFLLGKTFCIYKSFCRFDPDGIPGTMEVWKVENGEVSSLFTSLHQRIEISLQQRDGFCLVLLLASLDLPITIVLPFYVTLQLIELLVRFSMSTIASIPTLGSNSPEGTKQNR
jgi:hypothetical protein